MIIWHQETHVRLILTCLDDFGLPSSPVFLWLYHLIFSPLGLSTSTPDHFSCPMPYPFFLPFPFSFPARFSLSYFPLLVLSSIASFLFAPFSSWLGFLLFPFRSSFLILGRLLVCRDFCYGVSEIQTLFPSLTFAFHHESIFPKLQSLLTASLPCFGPTGVFLLLDLSPTSFPRGRMSGYWWDGEDLGTGVGEGQEFSGGSNFV